MKRPYREYTNEDVIKAVDVVKSMAGLLKKLGLKPAGGNYINMKRKLQELNLKCPTWTGQGWNNGKQLKDWSKYTKVTSIKPHLIKLRGRMCENTKCKLTKWLGLDISLEIHHIDGDRTNNRLSNLQLLCPNCHSFTDYYRNRKMSALVEKQDAEHVEFGGGLTANAELSKEETPGQCVETKRRVPKAKAMVKT